MAMWTHTNSIRTLGIFRLCAINVVLKWMFAGIASTKSLLSKAGPMKRTKRFKTVCEIFR